MKKTQNICTDVVEKSTNPTAIGNRVKSARMLSGLTRTAFFQKTGISAATLRIWEEPNEGRNGLSSKGVKRLILALGTCGVHCSEEWLLNGLGAGPKLINLAPDNLFKERQKNNLWTEEESILKDIDAFIQNNLDATVSLITDNSMMPLFSIGDYVGGSKKRGGDIKKLVGLNCIIELQEKTIIRRISGVNENNRFTLTAINHDTGPEEQVIINVEIKSAAEIVWHRWKQRQKD